MDELPDELICHIGSQAQTWGDVLALGLALGGHWEHTLCAKTSKSIDVESVVQRSSFDGSFANRSIARFLESDDKWNQLENKVGWKTKTVCQRRVDSDTGRLSAFPDLFAYKYVNFGIVTDVGNTVPLKDLVIIVKLYLPGQLSNIYQAYGGPALRSASELKTGAEHKYYTDYAKVVGFQLYGTQTSIRRALLAFQLRRARCFSFHDESFTYELGDTKIEPSAGERAKGSPCSGPGIYFFMCSHDAMDYASISHRCDETPVLTNTFASRRGLVFDMDEPVNREQAERRVARLNSWLRERAGIEVEEEEKAPPPPPPPGPLMTVKRPVDEELDAAFGSFISLFPEIRTDTSKALL